MKATPILALLACILGTQLSAKSFKAADYGIAPGKSFKAEDVQRLLADVSASTDDDNTIDFEHGTYDIDADQCVARTWYISNHDQPNPKRVFLPLENKSQLKIRGNGAFFNLKRRIIPIGIWDCDRVTVENLTIDYETPPLTQINITAVNRANKTVTFRPIKGSNPELEGRRLFFKHPDGRTSPNMGILFEANGTIAFRTSDLGFNLGDVTANENGTYTAGGNGRDVFKAGQAMALRTWDRPAPGIVLSTSKDTILKNVTIHYSDGMAVIAQACENITLDGTRIVPNTAKHRSFSSQADATHFSGCRGKIRSTNGEYAGMMDDAINVHGTYLRIQKRIDEHTLEAQYMHPQAYGFYWGGEGDKVQFIRSNTMELLAKEGEFTLVSVTPLDKDKVTDGAKKFRLVFAEELPATITPDKGALGVENLTWTPSVEFSHNIVKNNRARGALFSTPQRVLCTDNIFDHTSGCAILLCGDCNGWYETGACRDVTIRNNVFLNALTNSFQFTEAVISICPEIPNLLGQQRFFHSGILIEENLFETFDRPLIYAKSVDGLTIKNNRVRRNKSYPQWHNNKQWLTLLNCDHITAEMPVEFH